MTNSIVTQVELAIVTQSDAPDARVTRLVTQVAAYHPPSVPRVTQVNGAVAAYHPPSTPRVTQVSFYILATRSPNYRFISMVLPDVFPNDISYNSVGSTRFATDVIVVDSGDDQRVSRWDEPLMEYDVAYGIRTMEQLSALIAFFRAMRGRFYSFCYQDNVDFSSAVAIAYEARAAPPLTPLDQQLGLGDGLTFTFQLQKVYSTASQSQFRLITRPQPGSVRVAINAIETPFFTVDVTTGIVTFTTPLAVTFTTPITNNGGNSNGTLSAAAGTFNAFKPFVGRNFVSAGFTHPSNNLPITQSASIGSVSSDGSQLNVAYPPGYGLIEETVATGLQLSVHPAPPSDQVVTAGFLFYVPCRFDTDILPVTIEDYGVGGSNSVKLIEVRSSDQ